MDIPALPAWAWIPITLAAALAQTVRNAAQRSLVSQAGTLAATLARFLYGLPFALVFVALAQQLSGRPVPAFHVGYFGWVAMGAVAQLLATACLLKAMQQRNFIVGVAFSKTEVLQVALFGAVFLHELPTAWALFAMVLATGGVLLLSLPPRGQMLSASAWFGKSAMHGLICGACFAIATIGYRGAAVELNAETPWLSGAWGVLVAQLMQTLGLGAWVQFKTERGLAPIFRAWKISMLAGSMGAAASLAWFTAYAMQSAASVRTLGMVEVVFSYVVSRKVFSESFSRPEKIGIGLMLVGLVLICSLGT